MSASDSGESGGTWVEVMVSVCVEGVPKAHKRSAIEEANTRRGVFIPSIPHDARAIFCVWRRELTHSTRLLFPPGNLFFIERERRNKSPRRVVLPHANLHNTLWSSS